MKNLISILTFLSCFMNGVVCVSAQDFSEEAKHQVAQLDFMVGKWEGTGLAMLPNGQKGMSEVTETIRYDLDGTILRIRGVGLSEGVKVHDALGIIYYDPSSKALKMNSWLSKGMSTMAEVQLMPDGRIQWCFEPRPGVTIRYTIVISGNEWSETGEMSRDGENWNKFFEMNLEKTS